MTSGRRLKDGEVKARKLSDAFTPRSTISGSVGESVSTLTARRHVSYFYEPCLDQPITTGLLPGTAASGVDTEQAVTYLGGEGCMMNYVGTATRLGPTISSAGGGLQMTLDAAASEGAEYILNPHPGSSRGAHSNLVGFTTASFSRIVFAPVGGPANANFWFGFRANEAFAADVNDYEDLAALAINGAALVSIETIIGNAATDATSTGVVPANGILTELKLVIDGSGNVRFYVNGEEYAHTATASLAAQYTFTDGLVVQPFLYAVNGAGAVPITLYEWEAGPVSEVARGL